MASCIELCHFSAENSVFSSIYTQLDGSVAKDVQDMTTETFPSVLEGEWMLEL